MCDLELEKVESHYSVQPSKCWPALSREWYKIERWCPQKSNKKSYIFVISSSHTFSSSRNIFLAVSWSYHVWVNSKARSTFGFTGAWGYWWLSLMDFRIFSFPTFLRSMNPFQDLGKILPRSCKKMRSEHSWQDLMRSWQDLGKIWLRYNFFSKGDRKF